MANQKQNPAAPSFPGSPSRAASFLRAPEDPVPWSWNHIALRLPPDWELLRFSKNPAQGSLLFADEARPRLELSWRQVPREPDWRTFLQAYRSKLLEQEGVREAHLLPQQNGLLVLNRDGGTESRFGRFLEDRGLLVELVFPWPGVRRSEIEESILSSLQTTALPSSGRQAWRCFGIDLSLDSSWQLESCRALPADVELAFRLAKPSRATLAVQRRGLATFWMTAPLPQWMRQRAEGDIVSVDQRNHPDHGAICRQTERIVRRKSLFRFVRRERRSIAWICPRDGRLYRGIIEYPLRKEPAATAQVSCCSSCSVTV